MLIQHVRGPAPRDTSPTLLREPSRSPGNATPPAGSERTSPFRTQGESAARLCPLGAASSAPPAGSRDMWAARLATWPPCSSWRQTSCKVRPQLTRRTDEQLCSSRARFVLKLTLDGAQPAGVRCMEAGLQCKNSGPRPRLAWCGQFSLTPRRWGPCRLPVPARVLIVPRDRRGLGPQPSRLPGRLW